MCVSCQTDVSGRRALPVKEDRIIRAIRAVKKALGIAQMNELYVCEACLPKHNERRRSFEKTLLFASVLAGIMLILLILVPMLSGRFEAWAILSGFVVAGFIVLVPIMFKYVPAVAGVSSTAYPSSVRWAPPIPQAQPGAATPPPPEPRPAPAPPVEYKKEQPSAPPPRAAVTKPAGGAKAARPAPKKSEGAKDDRSSKKSRKK